LGTFLVGVLVVGSPGVIRWREDIRAWQAFGKGR
jgi:hypothetical protein